LATDVNGNTYVGEFNDAFSLFTINKLNCEGDFTPAGQQGNQNDDFYQGGLFDYGANDPYSFNFSSINGLLYAPGLGSVFVIDPCIGNNDYCRRYCASDATQW